MESDDCCPCCGAARGERRPECAEARGDQLYRALAVFDRRDGSLGAEIVQAAREGWERSHPDMGEDGAWDDFERLIALYNEANRPWGRARV